jgi:transcriptional regulator with XRE-family HTH domain
MGFGRHLRALREEAGLSRSALAKQARVPVGTLRNWETDRGFPPLAALSKLARVLGVPMERLAVGTVDEGEEESAAAPKKPHGRGKGR